MRSKDLTATIDTMKIYLLTHQREFKRPSNTGNIVTRIGITIAKAIPWERKNSNLELLETIKDKNTVLLFNNPEAEIIKDKLPYDNFIILDGTWQEAKKIYNKSPYLKEMKTINLQTGRKSIYSLRRNQKENGLCTAECVAEILRLKGKREQAEKLDMAFQEFMNQWTIKKSQP
ncbi:MAG: hypothetical protein B6241_08885 [Spirochaetaceae bacterium 4572_59]|nr:MAG: hypothetical protein B6241_08885 [Spirochaetaceae bacterium 4572_59]